MGNRSTKRSSNSNNSTKSDHQKLKLAPTDSCENGIECPICFLNFAELNSMRCCSQHLCTSCYVQLKTQGDSPHCPFCDHHMFLVSYTPGPPKETTETPPRTIPSSDISSQSATTPLTASISDREQIEQEIRRQHELFSSAPGLPPRAPAVERRHTGSSRLRFYASRNHSRSGARSSGGGRAEILEDYLIRAVGGLDLDADMIEEMMVSEAIQRSLQAEERNRQPAADSPRRSASPVSSRPTEQSGTRVDDRHDVIASMTRVSTGLSNATLGDGDIPPIELSPLGSEDDLDDPAAAPSPPLLSNQGISSSSNEIIGSESPRSSILQRIEIALDSPSPTSRLASPSRNSTKDPSTET